MNFHYGRMVLWRYLRTNGVGDCGSHSKILNPKPQPVLNVHIRLHSVLRDKRYLVLSAVPAYAYDPLSLHASCTPLGTFVYESESESYMHRFSPSCQRPRRELRWWQRHGIRTAARGRFRVQGLGFPESARGIVCVLFCAWFSSLRSV